MASVEIWEKPQAETIYMLMGWRQWADAGSISSGLPQYLIDQHEARHIGKLNVDDSYLFQIPGTHDLVRPIVKFQEGYPQVFQTYKNDLFYAGDETQGVVYFVGDEPHVNGESYVAAILDAAEQLKVKRIISFGGVYGEFPYDKERLYSSIYSLKSLRSELEGLAVNLSDYVGGASIGSYVCKRAEAREMEFVEFYAFVPTYDFSQLAQQGSILRIEDDYMAWYGALRRVKHMLKLSIDLTDLEEKSHELVRVLNKKIDELSQASPELNIKDYLQRLNAEFMEVTFDPPLDEVWENELRRLLDDE